MSIFFNCACGISVTLQNLSSLSFELCQVDFQTKSPKFMHLNCSQHEYKLKNIPIQMNLIFIFLAVSFITWVCGQENNTTQPDRDAVFIGPCTWILDRKCPDKDVKFFLFTPSNPDERQPIHIEDSWENSNLSSSNYDARFPVKIIVHGYNSDMQLTPLIDMKGEYLQRGKYNLFFVDWSVLGPAPCESFIFRLK